LLLKIRATKRWLDSHRDGSGGPLSVALHSAFKFGGLAGMAYWIMVAVVMSGIVRRYLYSQILQKRCGNLAGGVAKEECNNSAKACTISLPKTSGGRC
jgi:hypothetical protein